MFFDLIRYDIFEQGQGDNHNFMVWNLNVSRTRETDKGLPMIDIF